MCCKGKKEKKSFFVLFYFASLKIKVERDQQESQSRSGIRDINVFIEDQGGNLLKRR